MNSTGVATISVNNSNTIYASGGTGGCSGNGVNGGGGGGGGAMPFRFVTKKRLPVFHKEYDPGTLLIWYPMFAEQSSVLVLQRDESRFQCLISSSKETRIETVLYDPSVLDTPELVTVWSP